MKLAHICFADDLLVMCHGDSNSIKVIKKVLVDFGKITGLLPNISKSTVFFGSVPLATQHLMTQILPFEVGRLTIKYLGVPLLSKKFIKECKSLIDKVKNKDPYPKGHPLGKWVNIIKLNGGSFWDVEAKYNDSWGWRYLLNIREKIKMHIDLQIINGSECYSWIDNDGKKVQFSIQEVWKVYRRDRGKVPWYHVIWFGQCDPKQAFILWLAVLSRLNTHDRLQKWMHNQNFNCVLCGQGPDSVMRLFFKCEFSLKVWRHMKSHLFFKGLPDSLAKNCAHAISISLFKKHLVHH
ncbi:uncharacterized protein [Rutidosis leptorrhynchoides]|uniref:uncharacterized protein n=1 Tax=Rutidosis leptorrhynchoides TaxID=125765 RepID=UPI003A99012D